MKILIVDDEKVALTSLRRVIRRKGFKDVSICEDGVKSIDLIKNNSFDIVVLDLMMPDINGLKILERTKPFAPDTEFIILTALEDIRTAVKSVRMGAYDYLVKPINNERLMLSLERAYERKGLRTGVTGSGLSASNPILPAAFENIITQSEQIKKILAYAKVMAKSGRPILITGESGTGKELLAKGLHKAGPYSGGPFIPVNVSSIPEDLFESQFFGYAKGAFAGAEKNVQGYFEKADEGTLFLDEIGEMPVSQQSKILRVLEEKSILRLGGASPIPIDIQIISSTNQDLDKKCQEEQFRLDLLFRLNSAHIHLPPLRDRKGDIMLLAGHFLKKASLSYQKSIVGFDKEATDYLINWVFPGNIRELQHIVDHAVLISEGPMIELSDIDKKREEQLLFNHKMTSLKEAAETHTAYVLNKMKGDRRKTADVLGISVRQVQRRISQMKSNPKWEALFTQIGDTVKVSSDGS